MIDALVQPTTWSVLQAEGFAREENITQEVWGERNPKSDRMENWDEDTPFSYRWTKQETTPTRKFRSQMFPTLSRPNKISSPTRQFRSHLFLTQQSQWNFRSSSRTDQKKGEKKIPRWLAEPEFPGQVNNHWSDVNRTRKFEAAPEEESHRAAAGLVPKPKPATAAAATIGEWRQQFKQPGWHPRRKRMEGVGARVPWWE